MIPDAYKTGFKRFYGRYFFVNQNVLIPRIETEGLIDIVKDFSTQEQVSRVCDAGTGSGCIGITLKLELPNLDLTLLDLSDKALEVAKINAKRLKADVRIIKNDLLDKNYDLVVANLPYIPHRRIRYLMSDVRDYEPHLALDGGEKGLELIYKLLNQCLKLSVQYIVLEIDDTHKISDFKKYQNIYKIEIIKDIFKRNRYAILRRNTVVS